MPKYGDFMDLTVSHDFKNRIYYIQHKHNNQTYELGIEYDRLHNRSTLTAVIYACIYSKRKDKYLNQYNIVSSGKDIFYSYSFFKQAFKLLEQEIIKEFNIFSYKKLIIYCWWTDNRRRDVYYKVLSKYGYDYMQIHNKRVIGKILYKEDNDAST